MKKEHKILLAVNVALIAVFGTLFLVRMNYEFVIYVGVIIGVLALVGATVRKVDYTTASLVGLTVWAALHLFGGGVPVGQGRLYDIMLLPLSDSLPVLRYDQAVHAWGFGASTLVMYSLLRRPLHDRISHPVALSIVLVMAGMGVGAFNEVPEFVVDLAVPESGVGGYINTSLDLCANLVGALGGMVYVHVRYVKNTSPQ
jgi:hypothetical protein